MVEGANGTTRREKATKTNDAMLKYIFSPVVIGSFKSVSCAVQSHQSGIQRKHKDGDGTAPAFGVGGC